MGRIEGATLDDSRVAFRRLFGSRARTFSFAARFLPEGRRLAVESLYAFCRTVDDLADEYPTGVGRPLLDEWWQWVDGLERRRPGPPPAPAPDRPGDENLHLTAALRDVVERFGVPPRSLRLLVEGVRSDTERTAIGRQIEFLNVPINFPAQRHVLAQARRRDFRPREAHEFGFVISREVHRFTVF